MDAALKDKLASTLHIFSADAGEVQGSWESQKDEYRQKMLTLADRMDRALTTLNQTVVRIDAPIVPTSFEQTLLPHMIAFMQKFIAEKVKHPKGVADLFPTEELARLLILEFGYRKLMEPQPSQTYDGHIPTETKPKREPTPGQKAYYERNKKNVVQKTSET